MKRRNVLKNLAAVPLAGVAGHEMSVFDKPGKGGEWLPKKEQIAPVYKGSAPVSLCIRSGHLVFLSGIGGWYEHRRAEPGDIKVQIASALTDMKNQLEQAGTSMANVLKVHMTVVDPNNNIGPLNEVYQTFFPDPKPARSYTGCTADLMGRDGILVQIDCVAYID
ncbi:MAG TPA: RidA family protein [Bacteroidales bacterium]|jgi:2-iminobutanoate/2-iminopropanoate deaminase|nr:RidA family protein [Bacteroidales bacterium]HOS71735.1 RidA family protein [Bacteroidales bacterium]HQH24930.1 RidA family protein [Bacteroidales bacterium]HQJ82334.1 RidA family protein [Bacteroidales bacterium]